MLRSLSCRGRGFEAQAAGSQIKLFLLPYCNVTISINYQGCSVCWLLNCGFVLFQTSRWGPRGWLLMFFLSLVLLTLKKSQSHLGKSFIPATKDKWDGEQIIPCYNNTDHFHLYGSTWLITVTFLVFCHPRGCGPSHYLHLQIRRKWLATCLSPRGWWLDPQAFEFPWYYFAHPQCRFWGYTPGGQFCVTW